MTPEEWRALVGVHIERRRRELGIRSMRAAVADIQLNESSWRQLETGRRQLAKGVVVAPSPNEHTTYLVGQVLEWGNGWLDELLAGREPRARLTKGDLGLDYDPNAPPAPSPVTQLLARIADQLEVLTAKVDLLLDDDEPSDPGPPPARSRTSSTGRSAR